MYFAKEKLRCFCSAIILMAGIGNSGCSKLSNDSFSKENITQKTNSLSNDTTTAPTVTGTSPTNSPTPTWTWKTGGGGSGTYRYVLDNSVMPSDATTTILTTFTPNSALAEGAHILYVQEQDASGNWSTSGFFTITIILKGPNAPIVTGSATSTTSTPSWTWSSGGGGGSGNYRYKVDSNTFTSADTSTTSTSYKPITGLTDGSHTLYVQERDAVGNWSASGSYSTVVSTIPVLTSLTNKNFPSGYLAQGSTFTQDFNNLNSGSDSGMTYACTFDQVIDGAVASGNACTSLPGTVSFNTTTGVFSWTPNAAAFGPYEIKVTGSNSVGTGSKNFVIDVRPSYVSSNLLGDWDAQFADLTEPVTGNVLSWKDLTSNGYDGTLNSTSHASWTGSGSYSSPYALSFDGSGSVDFGTTVGSSSTKMMFSSWINSSNVSSSSDAVLLGSSGNATGNGFTVRQHPSYRDAVMSLNPIGYWRLGESSGTTAVDLGSAGHNGTYYGGYRLSQTGALTADSDNAALFDGSSGYLQASDAGYPSGTQPRTISLWVKPNVVNGTSYAIMMYGSYTGTGKMMEFAVSSGNQYFVSQYGSALVGSAAQVGVWAHLVATYDGTTYCLYVNGILANSGTMTTNLVLGGNVNIGKDPGGTYFPGTIDDVAIFNTALSSAQVATLYKIGTVGKKNGFCYWSKLPRRRARG